MLPKCFVTNDGANDYQRAPPVFTLPHHFLQLHHFFMIQVIIIFTRTQAAHHLCQCWMEVLLILEIHCSTAHYGFQLAIDLLHDQKVLSLALLAESDCGGVQGNNAGSECFGAEWLSINSQNESSEVMEEVLVRVDQHVDGAGSLFGITGDEIKNRFPDVLHYNIIELNNQHSMQRLEQSFEAELAICYDNSSMVKYINNQIMEVQGLIDIKCVNRFTLVKFTIPNSTNLYSFSTDHHRIEFVFLLGKNYPLTPPRVHIRNNLLQPGINDCRDLLPDIIGTEDWDYRINLKHIQRQIAQFLAHLEKTHDIYYIARIGTFQLNSVYPIQLINELREENIFYSFEVIGEADFKMIVIDVTATHLCIFTTKEQPYNLGEGFKIPGEKDITLCMLTFYAELGSITGIYVDRNNFSDIQLVFTSQKPHNMTLETCSKTKKLKVKKGINFLHKLLKNRKYYETSEIKIELVSEHQTSDQKDLQQRIEAAEKQIEHHLNAETVKILVDRYQAAVEYYSSNNIPYYELYLDYITKLYQRKDVRTIMGTDLPQ